MFFAQFCFEKVWDDHIVVSSGSDPDLLFVDLDRDGQQDGNEPGVDGATVNLYVDANNNGQQDGSEPGLPGVTIRLDGTDLRGQVVEAVTATGDGTVDLNWNTLDVNGNPIDGYAVLYPNYRGSTGRGVAFSKLDQADYAGGEFNDLVDGVKHLVSQGLVDENKVGVTGGSYGGFASAWCATKSWCSNSPLDRWALHTHRRGFLAERMGARVTPL